MSRMETRKQRGDYDGKIAGLYDLEDTIGRGHFAVVKLARHVFTGEKVAVKVIDKTKLDEISRSHLFQEVRCMKLVQHPNVVRLYEVIDTQTKLYLILELGDGGDMYDYIMKHDGGLEESTARRYFRQIVEAISYCHQLHVVHRDLKPENVVFFEKLGLVKLTDFGFSNMFNPGKNLETSCGSLAYSAPEILLGDSYDAPAVDVWSLGVILYMLVCGCAPFQEANDSETLTMIMDCKFKIPEHVSSHCKNLITGMLIREPSRRLTLDQILHHPWLAGGGDYIPTTYIPLITHEHLTEEDHSYVVQRMVEGKIASKDEIVSSLDKDSYDHITATYYLLAERKLKRHQQELQQAASQIHKYAMSHGQKPHLEPLSLSPRVQQDAQEQKESVKPTYVQSLVSPPGTHPSPSSSPKRNPASPEKIFKMRKCSLIKEESQEESQDDGSDMDVDEAATIKSVQSCESLEELFAHSQHPHQHQHQSSSRQASYTQSPSQASRPSPSPSKDPPMNRRPLKSVNSSPQLLNQIYEENESDEEEDFVPSKLHSPRTYVGMASPEILRKYEQRKKRRGPQRGASCSSSDASDTDDTEGRSRKDKLKHKFVHRRDSSDHSSDTDGPSGHGGNIGGGARFGGGGGGSRGSQGGNKKGSGKDNSDNRGSKGHGGQGSKQNQANMASTELNLKALTKKLSQLSVNSLSSASSGSSGQCATSSVQWTIGNTPMQYVGRTESELYIESKSLQFSDLSEYTEHEFEERSVCSSDCVLMQRKGHRSGSKVTTDINSNGLPPTFCKPGGSQQLSVMKLESKCCSVV